jgi:hypothetical protein
MEFARDGGGLAKGGTVTLSIDGKEVGDGRVERTEPCASPWRFSRWHGRTAVSAAEHGRPVMELATLISIAIRASIGLIVFGLALNASP